MTTVAAGLWAGGERLVADRDVHREHDLINHHLAVAVPIVSTLTAQVTTSTPSGSFAVSRPCGPDPTLTPDRPILIEGRTESSDALTSKEKTPRFPGGFSSGPRVIRTLDPLIKSRFSDAENDHE